MTVASLVVAATAIFGFAASANAQSLLEMALQNGWTFAQFETALALQNGGSSNTGSTGTTCGTSYGYTVSTITLRSGMNSAAVSSLQTALNAYAGASLTVDGAYGPATASAVRNFQQSQGLLVDGIAGAATQGALKNASLMTGSDCDNSDDSNDDMSSNFNMDGSQGSINSKTLGTPEESDVNEGDSNQEIYVLEVELDDEGDLMVESLDVWFASADAGSQSQEPWDYFDEVMLMVDGEEVASMDADESDFSDDSNGQIESATTGEEYRMRFTDLDFVLESDETTDVSIAVTVRDVVDGDDDGETWYVAISQMRVVDGTGFVTNEAFDTGSAGTLEDSFTVNASAEEASLDVTEASDSPEASIIEISDSIDTNKVNIFAFDIEEDNDIAVNIEEMTLTFTALTSTAQAQTENVVMKRAYLYQGDEKVGDESMTSNGVVVFDNMDIDIDGDDTETFWVKVDFEDTNDQARYEDGTTVSVTVTSLDKYEDENGNDEGDFSVSPSATSETHELRTEGISVSFVSSTEARTFTADESGEEDQGTYEIIFEVTATGADMFIDKSTEDDNGSDAAGQGVVFDINSSTGTATVSSKILSSTTTDSDDTATAYIVNENETRRFKLQVILTADISTSDSYEVILESINWDNESGDTTPDFFYDFDLDEFKTDYLFLQELNA